MLLYLLLCVVILFCDIVDICMMHFSTVLLRSCASNPVWAAILVDLEPWNCVCIAFYYLIFVMGVFCIALEVTLYTMTYVYAYGERWAQ